jgi:hypothetical protein
MILLSVTGNDFVMCLIVAVLLSILWGGVYSDCITLLVSNSTGASIHFWGWDF